MTDGIVSRPPRLQEFSYIGPYRYFLTICAFHRRKLFAEVQTVQLLCTHFRESSERCGMAINVYCAMPDHFHLLATGLTEKSDLRQFVEAAKQRSGWTFKQQCGRTRWQKGYYDRILREHDDDAAVIAYIVNNPVRARLVASPSDYSFWGSFTHTREQVLQFIAGVPEWKKPA